MKIDIGTPQEVAALFTALAKAKAAFKPISKNKTVRIERKNGGSYSYEYATMEAILDATEPALSENGIVILQPFEQEGERGERMSQLTILAGHGAVVTFKSLWDCQEHWVNDQTGVAGSGPMDIKDLGGELTYRQRYAYTKLLNLSTDADAEEAPRKREGDANVSAGPRAQKTAPKQPEAPRAPAKTAEQSLVLKDLTKQLGFTSPAEAEALCRKVTGQGPAALTFDSARLLIEHMQTMVMDRGKPESDGGV